MPPAEGIRERRTSDAAMMLPSSPQLPPSPSPTPHRSITRPVSRETFFSRLVEKKATHCPSGEKNGACARSVPASSVAVAWLSRLANNFD